MEDRMTNMASRMAIAIPVATEPFMPHSTPLLSTTSVAVACGVSGSGFHPSHRYLRLSDAAKTDELHLLGGGF